MKRIIAMLLTAFMVLSFTACGNQDNSMNEIPQDSQHATETEITQSQTEEASEPEATESTGHLGESRLLGRYEQDNNLENGKEPIEWIIIREDGDSYYLMSRYVLDFKNFHSERFNDVGDISWEESNIRAWLNGEFYEESFTDEEKAQILLTIVDNSEEQAIFYEGEKQFFGCFSYGYHQGTDTEDYVYLLSDYEFRRMCYERGLFFKENPDADRSLASFASNPLATTYAYSIGIEYGDRQINSQTNWCTCLTRTRDESKYVFVIERGSNNLYEYWRQPFGIQPVLRISK